MHNAQWNMKKSHRGRQYGSPGRQPGVMKRQFQFFPLHAKFISKFCESRHGEGVRGWGGYQMQNAKCKMELEFIGFAFQNKV